MNFGQIKTEVGTWVIDLPASVTALVPNLVNRALKKLQTKHNYKVMEADATFTTTFGSRVIGTRPSDWKEPRNDPYYVEELGGVRQMFWTNSAAEGVFRYGNNPDLDFGDPRLIFEDTNLNQFLLYPYPDGISDYADGEYRLVVPYWKMIPAMTQDTDTNWFTQNAEDYLIYQAVAMAFYANEDESRAQVWDVLAAKEYKDVVLADKRRRLAEMSSTFVPHLGALMPHSQE